MKRFSVIVVLLSVAACADPETPPILDGTRGACGSVVEGATPDQVECPSECPIAVDAYRVIDSATCQRSTTAYVACIRAGGGGQPGTGILDTDVGPIFVDDPAIDCNREEGCTEVATATTDRWQTCAQVDDPACHCACEGGECAFDRFVDQIDDCGLPTPCEPLTGDSAPTDETLQCYMDILEQGGPIKIEMDVPATNHVTGESTVARTVLAVDSRSVTRLRQVAYDQPSSVCDLQEANFFLTCDPEDPGDFNIENADGLIERVPCTDPRAWVLDCLVGEPVCPS